MFQSWKNPIRQYEKRAHGHIVIAVDTSGSIDERTLGAFRVEAQAVLDECAPEVMEVIYCDAAIQNAEEFRPGDMLKLNAKGGGGTDFRPVFSEIEERDEIPAALVYLTDGHGSFPSEEPEYPVLWASTESESYPFGQVLLIGAGR